VHNIYMLSAAELGLPFAAVFAAFMILVLWVGIQRCAVIASLWFCYGLIGFMDSYLLVTQIGRILFFTTAALALFPSILSIGRDDKRESSSRSKGIALQE